LCEAAAARPFNRTRSVDAVDTLPVPKKSWELTAGAFEKLLSLLHPEPERAGLEYERVRDKLILYFEGRRCSPADEYADEVINRVARRLEAGEEVREINRYVYGVARLLLLEIQRQPRIAGRDEDDDPLERLQSPTPPEHDPRQDCLEECLGGLAADKKEMILEYYSGDEGRQIEIRARLAERQKLTPNALKIKACRVRQKLEDCINACVGRAAG
jgi:DNA-directed RNA polymerase specialized sigma24 family protein